MSYYDNTNIDFGGPDGELLEEKIRPLTAMEGCDLMCSEDTLDEMLSLPENFKWEDFMKRREVAGDWVHRAGNIVKILAYTEKDMPSIICLPDTAIDSLDIIWQRLREIEDLYSGPVI